MGEVRHRDLAGKTAFVAAASRGLGRAAAEALAHGGADLILCARDPQRLQEVAGEIRRSSGVRVHTVAGDLTDRHQVEAMAAEALSAAGGVDVLVANGPGPRLGRFFDFTDDDWAAMMEAHFYTPMRLARAFLPGMVQRGWGRLIFVVSRTVREPRPDNIMSGAVRLPIVSVAKCLAWEFGASGVTSNVLSVGAFLTERLREVLVHKAEGEGTSVEEQERLFARNAASGRIGRPEEFGEAVRFLASDAAAFINGTMLAVDGGSLRTLM